VPIFPSPGIGGREKGGSIRRKRETTTKKRGGIKSRTLDVLLQVRHRAVHRVSRRVKKGGGGGGL
tara:strand:+ start:115 stop:309 length:195 start_codon:yes stop_codon:yes gene_type:complete